jgi:hypothetical protein
MSSRLRREVFEILAGAASRPPGGSRQVEQAGGSMPPSRILVPIITRTADTNHLAELPSKGVIM